MPDPNERFLAQINAAVERYAMLSPGDRVLVALSGGQDSMALLHCLHGMDIPLGAAHLHHGMRAEVADADVAFLRAWCAETGVPLCVEEVSVPELAATAGVSLEQAGREARYRLLNRVAEEEGFTRIALGHTATDRAETVLMNVLRGSGLEGLRGIPPVNGRIIRPLILVTRQQTEEYCLAHGLAPRLDCTNLDTEFSLRNRIRLCLLPLVEAEYAAGASEALARLAEIAEQELQWTEPWEAESFARVVRADEEGLGLNLVALRGLPPGLQRRVVRRALVSVAGSAEGLCMGHVEDVLRLALVGRTGARVSLPFEMAAERGYNEVWVSRGDPPCEEPAAWQVALPIPGVAELPGGGRVVCECVPRPKDLRDGVPGVVHVSTRVGEALMVRNRRPGDRVHPLGMAGTRKVKDLLIDRKAPRQERERIPVVLDCGGRIVWVAGVCLSQEAALRPEESECIRLEWTPRDGAIRPGDKE